MTDRTIDLSIFKKIQEGMIAKNSSSLNEYYNRHSTQRLKDYTLEEIETIINSSSLDAQQKLSRNYFNKDGFYKKIIFYYATLLKYNSILIPNPGFGKKLSTPHIAKRYYSALEYINKLNLPELLTKISLRALVDGGYYGVIYSLDKDQFVLIDLPSGYSCSRFKDIYGNDIVEFDVRYFNTIVDDGLREEILYTYPKEISAYYKKYSKGKVSSSWVKLPSDIGISFSFSDDARPPFLSVIPATIQYDDAVDTERERELEEIRKILVQKIPHLTDGQLLFEPEEALEMHAGAVGMLKGNKNISVLTTYADVDAIVSKTTNENNNSTLEKMLQNIYSEAGVSSQIFSSTGSQAINISIANDTSFMMVLGNQYSRFISYILNKVFGNSNINFKFKILPITYYNYSDYVSDALKLAQNGYSYLLPIAAMDIAQGDLTNLKELENEVLKLQDVLIPLSSSYQQSSSESTGEVGAPEKALEDKSEKTIQNENAIDNQGQGGS